MPLLVKLSPLPNKRMIGDMSDTEKVLKGLGISR
ncbi:circadian clock KaiB family protein [Dyadobacter sp. CY323]|nr:circadian clock KaiB family protein [Dyadobacter sp. CY323]